MMKIARRLMIGVLIVAITAVWIYVSYGIKEPPGEISADNVTLIKAPEQTAAMEHPDFIKEEFVLELPEGENIAVDKEIKASSFTDVYVAGRAVDGTTDGGSYWEGDAEYPNTLTVDFGETAMIHAIRLALNPLTIWGKRNQTIAVNISKDGENYTELSKMKQYTFDPDTGNQVQITFDEVEARYVQLVITENSGAGGGQIAEFEVYGK